jgi:ABC-2 type transport system ATP-binding protein
MGFLRPTSGWARVDGLDCFAESVRVRQSVSYLPGDARLFARMRGRDVLRFFTDMRGTEPDLSLSIARQLDLDVHRRVAFMSTGMRQKLALTVALSSKTSLVILDEPTANLDPNVRREVMRLIADARRDGRTVILCSHILSEIEEICDRVVILRRGEVVHTQTMSQLRNQHQVRGVLMDGVPTIPEVLRDRVELGQLDEHRVVVKTTGDLAPIMPWLSSLALTQVSIEPVGLRSVYERYHSTEPASF